MKRPFVLFDFDGVIADSFLPAFRIQKMKYPDMTEEFYRKCFEENINKWEKTDHIHANNCRREIDFFTEYIPKLRTEVQLIEHINSIIIELVQTYTLFIISSTLTQPLKEFLEKFNLASYFTQILGNDINTSKVEKIKMIFSEYNAEAKDCVFITDTLGDINEALKLGVGSIGVTWGFHSAETLRRGQPFQLVQKPADLPLAVTDYFASNS